MARMTALDITSFIRKGMGNPTTGEWDDDLILRLANMAQDKICSTHHPETVEVSTDLSVTLAGGATYEIGVDDCMYIKEIYNLTDGFRMKPDSRNNQERSRPLNTRYGNPYRWTETGRGANDQKRIELDCTPNAAKTLRIWYNKMPDELALIPTPTSSELSQEWDEVIIHKAIELGLALDQRRSEGSAHSRWSDDSEQRAARSRPKEPERHWGIETFVGRSIRPATTRRRR